LLLGQGTHGGRVHCDPFLRPLRGVRLTVPPTLRPCSMYLASASRSSASCLSLRSIS
jgi:hypothetical protein